MVLSIGISILPANTWAKQKNYIDYVIKCDPADESISVDLPFDSVERSISSVMLPPSTSLNKKRLYLKHYYNGLTENFSENQKGSCTFVALGMMLSYFDSYLSDDIIPEQYDVASNGNEIDIIERNNSPGVLYDTLTDDEARKYYRKDLDELSVNQFYYLLKRIYSSNSLQFKLAELAVSYQYLSLYYEDQETLSLSASESRKLFKNYLNSVGYQENTDYEQITFDAYEFNDDIKQFIISNIDLGRPVFVTAYNELSRGHAFVCYDYDSTSIYAHMGWRGSIYTHYNPFISYNRNIKAFTVDFKFDHTHSYNYMVGDKAYCYCDDAIEAYHNHSYGIPLKLNKQYHVSYCKCGLTKKGMHWIRGATNERYAKCGACGELLDLWSDIVVGIKSMNKTPNGSYISKSGIPVIAEPDVEAYLNGTLKFGGGFSDYDYI